MEIVRTQKQMKRYVKLFTLSDCSCVKRSYGKVIADDFSVVMLVTEIAVAFFCILSVVFFISGVNRIENREIVKELNFLFAGDNRLCR